MNLVDFFFWFKKEPRVRGFVLVSCIIGTAFGFYYYQEQLRASPIYLWFFIPDSPFFTFMYVIVLLLYSFGVRFNFFDVFTFIGLNKVGVWTIFVLFLNYEYYFSPETREFRLVILLLHIGMILIAMTLLKEMKRLSLKEYLLLYGYFALSDFMDYIVGTHPLIPLQSVYVVMWMSVALTMVIPTITFYYISKYH